LHFSELARRPLRAPSMSRNPSPPELIRARALAFASEVVSLTTCARGLLRSDATRLRELETHNARLRELLAQQSQSQPQPLT